VQEHVLAAIVRRDEAKTPRMIEELDRPGLAHGKLLSPFQMIRLPIESRITLRNFKDGESNRDAS
jgi:hypothetical protein